MPLIEVDCMMVDCMMVMGTNVWVQMNEAIVQKIHPDFSKRSKDLLYKEEMLKVLHLFQLQQTSQMVSIL